MLQGSAAEAAIGRKDYAKRGSEQPLADSRNSAPPAAEAAAQQLTP